MDRAQLDNQLGQLAAELDALEPNPGRGNWLAERGRLDALEQSCTWLLDNHEIVAAAAHNETQRRRLAFDVLERVAAAAAVLAAGTRQAEAKAILNRCADASPDAGDKAFYIAGVADPDSFAKAMRATWLFHHDHHDKARELARTLAGVAPPIAAFAGEIERKPVPVEHEPTLFSLYGFGLSFYGGRDEMPDGSEVQTRFFTAVALPLIPIDAYRVTEAGGQFRTLGKVPMQPFMRVWQVLGVLSLVGIVWGLRVFLDGAFVSLLP